MNKESEKLLGQIIEFAEIQDEKSRSQSINNGKGEKTVGQSWMVHHLNLLKQLLEEEK